MYIKPIETIYNGYRFRSRLEARWAVFFDAAGIKYQYESEGFELDNGVRYLPDFYLPEFNIFVEIKANREMDDGKAKKFAGLYTFVDCPYSGVLACYGDPLERDNTFYSGCEYDDDGGGFYSKDGNEFVLDAISKTPYLLMKGDRKWGRGFLNSARCIAEDYVDENDLHLVPINNAAIKARQARFEYGEAWA